MHTMVRPDTPVTVAETCVEVDECLETYQACGDPAIFENRCEDLINGYQCHCGNFTQIGYTNNPCDDFRMPHKSMHRNKCFWNPLDPSYPQRSSVRNSFDQLVFYMNNTQGPLRRDPYALDNEVELFTSVNYTCECDDGYFLATHPETGYQYCADVDDCSLDSDGDGRYGPCGHLDNQCHDEFRNHTCYCAQGYYQDINATTGRPICVDIDECSLPGPPICGSNTRDGMTAEGANTCTNTEGSYTCNCASGYRDNQLICAVRNFTNSYDFQELVHGFNGSNDSWQTVTFMNWTEKLAISHNYPDSLKKLLHSTAPGNFFQTGLPPVIIVQDPTHQILNAYNPWSTGSDGTGSPVQNNTAVYVHPLIDQLLALSISTDPQNTATGLYPYAPSDAPNANSIHNLIEQTNFVQSFRLSG